MSRTLTNSFTDFHLINLGSGLNGRGPFVLRQDGVPPNSMDMQEDRFFLRRDGVWVINFAVYDLSEEEQQAYIFHDIPAVWAAVETLTGPLVVESALPPGKSRAALLASVQSTMSRLLAHLRDAPGTPLAR